MKKLSYSMFFLFLIVSLVIASCSSGRGISGGSSKKCGCGVNRGFVGY
jgi:hypothetical protein